MSGRVAIVAAAQTKYASSRREVRGEELADEVVQRVLTDSGLTWADDGSGIDCAAIVCDDFWEGQTLSEIRYQSVTAGHLRDSVKISADGVQAVIYGAATILSKHMGTMFILAICKESKFQSRYAVTNYGFDPVYQRILGLNYLTAGALQAQRYMHQYGITREQCAKVVVKNRKNAMNNYFAQAPMDLTVEDVLQARMLATPIGVLDACPVSDGACAILLASEERAKEITDKPVWIKGVGNARDAHNLGDRELADCRSLFAASKKAYKMAGIMNPRQEIDLIELSEEYSYQELLWSEGLGLCGRGEGGKLIDSGVTQRNGELPVNPSGGLLSGVPTGVAGLSRVAEAFLQLRGEAGARQVAGAKTAVAHGIGGPAGQLQAVVVLGT